MPSDLVGDVLVPFEGEGGARRLPLLLIFDAVKVDMVTGWKIVDETLWLMLVIKQARQVE